jgi:hypothetical protein
MLVSLESLWLTLVRRRNSVFTPAQLGGSATIENVAYDTHLFGGEWIDGRLPKNLWVHAASRGTVTQNELVF